MIKKAIKKKEFWDVICLHLLWQQLQNIGILLSRWDL